MTRHRSRKSAEPVAFGPGPSARASIGLARSERNRLAPSVNARAAGPTLVFVNRLYYPDESATSQLLTDLTAHLSEAGRRVVVLASSSSTDDRQLPNRDSFRGVEIRRLWTAAAGGHSLAGRFVRYLSFYPGAFIALLKLLKSGDLVVAKTDPPLVSFVALVAARLKGARLVNWIQDLYPEVAVELQTPLVSGPVARVLGSLRNLALRHAVCNVAIGSTMAERLIRLGVPPPKVRTIQNWADEEAIRPLDPEHSFARRKWGFAQSDFVVGYSGNLGQAHEVETLVGAAKILRDRPQVQFLFVGGGHQHLKLKELIEEEGLQNFVFRPHQPREQLGDALAAADAHWVSLRPELEGLILPSKLFGILAAGRPVLSICDRRGEVSKLVSQHKCGLVVEPGDSPGLAAAIALLADDSELCVAMGRRARIASEQSFARSSALQCWSELLISLVQAPRREARQPFIP